MAQVNRFEDLDIWKKSRILANLVYDQTENKIFANDFGLKNQIQRASVSIMSNIAEGFERSGDKEFRRFLLIALGSTGEVRSQLYLAKDREYITDENFNTMYELSVELTKMLKRLIHYLNEGD